MGTIDKMGSLFRENCGILVVSLGCIKSQNALPSWPLASSSKFKICPASPLSDLSDSPKPPMATQPPPPVLTLTVEKGPRKGEIRQCIAGSALRVGRVVKGNDLAVRDTGASQQHLAIRFLPPPAAAVWAVSDLGSSNGTFLNGAPLVPSVPAPLSHGDLIKIGDSTVLAVSMAPDSDPNPVTNPSQRRSSRRTAAVVPVVVEEKPSVVPRRGTRKKAPQAAEPPRVEKEEQDAVAVVVLDERPQVVTRRGGLKKLVEEPPLGDREDTAEAPRLEEQKKAEEPSEPENDDEEKKEDTVVTRRGLRKKEEEANVVLRRGRQKKASALEPEKEGKEGLVVTHRGRRKKNEATVAPVPLPSKRRLRRVQRSEASSSAMKTVLDDDEVVQGGNELAASRVRAGNLLTLATAKGGEEQKGGKEATGHGGAEGTVRTLEEQVPKGRASAKLASSNNGVYAAVVELTEEIELAAEAPRRDRWKRTVEPPVQEKEEMDAVAVTHHDGQKKAAVVRRRVGRKKDAAIVAPPPQPPKRRSEKDQGRVTRASARNNVLQEEDKVEQEGNGVAAAREQAGNPSIVTLVHGGEDKEVKGSTDALEDEASKGRASAQHASSDNRGQEEQGGAHRSSRDDSGSNGIPNTTSKYREDRKLKAYSTPFDVRLDRALKKYSA